MHDLGHGAAISRTHLLQRDQVFTAEVELELEADLEGVGAVTVEVAQGAGDLGIAVGRLGGRLGGRIQGQALDILAFQGASFERVRHDRQLRGADLRCRRNGEGEEDGKEEVSRRRDRSLDRASSILA